MDILKHTIWFTLSGILMASIALPVLAQGAGLVPIPSYQAEYRLSRGRMTFARLEVILSYPSPNTYKFEAITTPIGLIAAFRDDVLTETSEGEIVNGEYRPLKYQYHRKSSKKNKLIRVDFDWQKMYALNHAKGSHWRAKIQPKTQDKLSKQLSMMLGLIKKQPMITVKVADGGKVKDYTYTMDKAESIEINDQSYASLKIKRKKNKVDSHITLWVDPAQSFVPVKVHKRENDGNYYLHLRKLIMNPSISPKLPQHQ